MIYALITLCFVLAFIIFCLCMSYMNFIKQKAKEMFDERQQWQTERQQLLDRIQASSFAEYKTAEIKVIKAQSGEKEPPKLEQL